MAESHGDGGAPLISVITPAFNEEANLEEFYRQTAVCLDAAGLTWEIIMVDDGSSDATQDVIDRLNQRDARVRGVSFARNFGNQVAVSAGLAIALFFGCKAVTVGAAKLTKKIALWVKSLFMRKENEK